MNSTLLYPQQSVFSSPLGDGYFGSFDQTTLYNKEANASFYPSPTESPLPNEMLVAPEYNDLFDELDCMMMVPPLCQSTVYDIPPVEAFMLEPSFYEHKAPAIDLVDQFIAQHQAALNSLPQEEIKQQQQQQEQEWSHWTWSSRDSTPEIVSENNGINSNDSSDPSSPVLVQTKISKDKKSNKVTKGPRRGRGKGVKNSIKKAAAALSTTSSKEPVEGALYVCQHDGCGRSFTRPYNLTSHMRTHTSDRPYACSHCGRKFARQHDRNRHEKLHWGIRPYACHHCHKSFARMDALNRHLRMENGCTGVHL